MIAELPMMVNLLFFIATVLTLVFFFHASRQSLIVLAAMVLWLGVQFVLGVSGFYQVLDGFPPRFLLLGLPSFLLVAAILLSAQGQEFIDGMNTKYLTYMHVVRLPVEIVLFWLFLEKHIPELMTFEGRNFDIFAGLTAPLVAYYG